MNGFRAFLGALLVTGAAFAGETADKPLYRDPVHDGAADPELVWNAAEGKWFMFYTNRRANVPGLKGVSWVQGTRIGIAESETGARWRYRGVAEIDYGEGEFSYWAPDIVTHGGVHHMFLTFVPGIHTDWGRERHILHLTSADLLKWRFESRLDLGSDRVIDACVFRAPGGGWRMWYKDEGRGSRTFVSESPDLHRWSPGKPAAADIACEGPKVFQWHDRYWMVTDEWRGLAVFQSSDCERWARQPANILEAPGTGLDDMFTGRHADVVVNGGRAYVFYFTHPGRVEKDEDLGIYATRRSSIQVAELRLENGEIDCDRNAPVDIRLGPVEDVAR
jgi:hypothetical protein